MRQLTEEQTRTLLEKLAKYIGGNTKTLIDRPDGTYCFREHKSRVYYASEEIIKQASNVNPDNFVSVGVCFGKFTKTGKFRLHITALHYIAPYAPYKIWVKPEAEQKLLYGNNVLKSGLARITESVPQYQGVIIYNMNDVPLGLGKEFRLLEFASVLYEIKGDVVSISEIKKNGEQYYIGHMAFGVTAKSTAECKHADPLTVICFNQSDIGEYIRCENDLL